MSRIKEIQQQQVVFKMDDDDEKTPEGGVGVVEEVKQEVKAE